jgi:hypothetical protein
MNVIERKNRLLSYVARRSEPIALDDVALTPPRVARFIYNIMERVPAWISCRSTQPKEIGAVWQYLYSFERIDLGPLSPNETASVIKRAVTSLQLPGLSRAHARQLHRLAKGNPRTLEELLVELSCREYRIEHAFDRKLLDLDRRIHRAGLRITTH